MTQIQRKHELQDYDDMTIDLTQSEYDNDWKERQEELDILDRKCEDWVNGKVGDAKNVDR